MKHSEQQPQKQSEIDSHKAYWKENLHLMAILLSIWFIVSFVFGIVLVEQLNSIRLGGFKLGFWFAQQGSMYCFVVLIYIYVVKMNKLDHKYDVDEDDDDDAENYSQQKKG